MLLRTALLASTLLASTLTFVAASVFTCTGGSLYVVAHPDDDLLFIMPLLGEEIAAGACITTVFLTSGDSGIGPSYATGRESGNEAATAFMAGVEDKYTEFYATFGGQPLLVRTLVGAPRNQKIWIRLPDGGYPDGFGYPSTGQQSVERLYFGTIPVVKSILGTATFTKATLLQALGEIMIARQPTNIRTLNYASGYDSGDHSDHLSVARFARDAQAAYLSANSTLTGFEGYPINNLPPNLTPAQVAAKSAAFFKYTPYDPSECTSYSNCQDNGRSEVGWLKRQYMVDTTNATTSKFALNVLNGKDVNIARSAVTSSSSLYSPQQNPSGANDGTIGGYKEDGSGDFRTEWVASNGRPGASILLTWPKSFSMNRVVLFDRPNLSDQILGGSLTFNDANSTVVAVPALANAGTNTTVSFPSLSASTLLFTVTAISSSTNNPGLGEIQVYGGGTVDPVLVAAIVANLSSISPISTAPAVGLVANSAGFNVTSSAALAFNFNSTSVADASSNATAVANSTLPSNTTLLSNATIPSNSTLLPLNGTQLTPLNSTVLGNIASTLPFDNSTAVLNSTATILNSTSILANATATVLSINPTATASIPANASSIVATPTANATALLPTTTALVFANASFATDVNNCGAANVVCPKFYANAVLPVICVNGGCQPTRCNTGFNFNFVTKVCQDITSDPLNCGLIAKVCVFPNGSGSCIGRICTLGQCNAGYSIVGGVCVSGNATLSSTATPSLNATLSAATLSTNATVSSTISASSAAISTSSVAISTASIAVANSSLAPSSTASASIASGSSYPSPVVQVALPFYNPTNNYARFARADASSETLLSEASKAIDGEVTTYPGDATKEWVSKGEGVGAFYRLTWPSLISINAVSIFDRPNPNDWVRGGNLSFSDGSMLPFGSISNNGSSKDILFTTRRVTWIQIQVTLVGSSTRNVGFAEVAVYGPLPFAPPGVASSVAISSAATTTRTSSAAVATSTTRLVRRTAPHCTNQVAPSRATMMNRSLDPCDETDTADDS